MAQEALSEAKNKIPLSLKVISINGEIINQ